MEAEQPERAEPQQPPPSHPRPTSRTSARDLSTCPACTQGQPGSGADAGPDIPHPIVLFPGGGWLVLVSFPGNPGLLFPSGNHPPSWNLLYVKARRCGGPCSIPRFGCKEHISMHTGHLGGLLSRLWASSRHTRQVTERPPFGAPIPRWRPALDPGGSAMAGPAAW